MKPRLIRVDGRPCLALDEALLERLQIDEGTPLSARVESGRLIVEPRSARIRASAARLLEAHAAAFEALAK